MRPIEEIKKNCDPSKDELYEIRKAVEYGRGRYAVYTGGDSDLCIYEDTLSQAERLQREADKEAAKARIELDREIENLQALIADCDDDSDDPVIREAKARLEHYLTDEGKTLTEGAFEGDDPT